MTRVLLRSSFMQLLCLFLLTAPLAGCGVNTVPTLEEQVNATWAQVQNEYKRRADLIPNLVSTVKGYATHEEQTLTEVMNARAKASSITLTPEMLSDPQAVQNFEQSQGTLNQALSRLMVVSERYPDLKANENFIMLQSQLEGTENRITVARRDYIAAVQAYNTYIRGFPGRIWAMIYGAKAKQSFTAPEGSENAPEVKF
jgi:LemA protein